MILHKEMLAPSQQSLQEVLDFLMRSASSIQPLNPAAHPANQPASDYIARLSSLLLLQGSAQKTALIDTAIQSIQSHIAQNFLDIYTFLDYTTIVDIGGGCGTLLVPLLQTYPQLQGYIVDLPVMQRSANTYLRTQTVHERCSFIASYDFHNLPANMDLYILASVLHQYTDTECLHILRKCRQAMSVHSRLLLIELLTTDESSTCDISIARTEYDYAALLEAAGFQLDHTIWTQSPFAFLESSPLANTIDRRPS